MECANNQSIDATEQLNIYLLPLENKETSEVLISNCKACVFREFQIFLFMKFYTLHIYIYAYTYILCMIFVHSRKISMSRKSLLGKTQTIHVREKAMLYSMEFYTN